MTTKIAGYETHPAADLFPLIEGEAFDALIESIRAHGQREPCIVWRGMLVDGRNRARACEAMGLEPLTVEADYADDEAVLSDVLDRNATRRHLTTSQRALVAARVACLPPWRPDESASREALSQGEAAQLFSVGRSSVQRARKVLDSGDPDLIDDVDQGRTTVAEAAELLKQREAERLAASMPAPIEAERAEAQADADREDIAAARTSSSAAVDAFLAGSDEWAAHVAHSDDAGRVVTSPEFVDDDPGQDVPDVDFDAGFDSPEGATQHDPAAEAEARTLPDDIDPDMRRWLTEGPAAVDVTAAAGREVITEMNRLRRLMRDCLGPTSHAFQALRRDVKEFEIKLRNIERSRPVLCPLCEGSGTARHHIPEVCEAPHVGERCRICQGGWLSADVAAKRGVVAA